MYILTTLIYTPVYLGFKPTILRHAISGLITRQNVKHCNNKLYTITISDSASLFNSSEAKH
jgi:hypothetical protein